MNYPGSERVEACARTFGELADTYYRMPCKKEAFDKNDIEEIYEEVLAHTCRECVHYEECWEKRAFRTYRTFYELLEHMETGTEEALREKLRSICICPERLMQSMRWNFRNMRMKMYYSNQLLENREAVADQLWEMSRLLEEFLDEVIHTGEMSGPMHRKICRMFFKRGVEVRSIFTMKNRNNREEVYITMNAQQGECVRMKDLAGILSVIMKRRMVPAREHRAMAGYEEETVLFVEDTKYHLHYGVRRIPKSGGEVSGDSYSFMQNNRGEAILCLSDGMGTGTAACAESERMIEMLEGFLEAGVAKDTAVKMVNSSAVYDRRSYSTVDMCSIDLHSGIGELRKLGGAPTFIYKDGQVEQMDSLRVPAGLCHHLDPEVNRFRVTDGTYIIMLTDGVLEAMAGVDKETKFAELIRELNISEPGKMAEYLMKSGLEQCGGKPADDMTLLVAGVWKKN